MPYHTETENNLADNAKYLVLLFSSIAGVKTLTPYKGTGLKAGINTAVTTLYRSRETGFIFCIRSTWIDLASYFILGKYR